MSVRRAWLASACARDMPYLAGPGGRPGHASRTGEQSGSSSKLRSTTSTSSAWSKRRQRPLEPPLADRAPRAHDVGPDLDLHGDLFDRSGRPGGATRDPAAPEIILRPRVRRWERGRRRSPIAWPSTSWSTGYADAADAPRHQALRRAVPARRHPDRRPRRRGADACYTGREPARRDPGAPRVATAITLHVVDEPPRARSTVTRPPVGAVCQAHHLDRRRTWAPPIWSSHIRYRDTYARTAGRVGASPRARYTSSGPRPAGHPSPRRADRARPRRTDPPTSGSTPWPTPARTSIRSTSTVEPSGPGCVECLADGGRWVHLRRCATCGHVGCCDSSPARHASAHAGGTGHAIVPVLRTGRGLALVLRRRRRLRDRRRSPRRCRTPRAGPPGHPPGRSRRPWPCWRTWCSGRGRPGAPCRWGRCGACSRGSRPCPGRASRGCRPRRGR